MIRVHIWIGETGIFLDSKCICVFWFCSFMAYFCALCAIEVHHLGPYSTLPWAIMGTGDRIYLYEYVSGLVEWIHKCNVKIYTHNTPYLQIVYFLCLSQLGSFSLYINKSRKRRMKCQRQFGGVKWWYYIRHKYNSYTFCTQLVVFRVSHCETSMSLLLLLLMNLNTTWMRS